MVVDLLDGQAAGQRLVGQSAPTRALDGGGGLRELGLELVEGAEVLVDCRAQRAIGLVAPVRALVLPEDRVEHVTRDVEGQGLLQADDRTEVVLVPGGFQLFQRLVGAGHVRRVVLVVMELHDLRRHMGLERGVVVGQIGKGVLSHDGGCSCVGGVSSVGCDVTRTVRMPTRSFCPPDSAE